MCFVFLVFFLFLASVTQRRLRLPACRVRRLWGFQIYFRALCHPFSIIRSRGPDDARLTESTAAALLVDEIVQKRNQARQQKKKKTKWNMFSTYTIKTRMYVWVRVQNYNNNNSFPFMSVSLPAFKSIRIYNFLLLLLLLFPFSLYVCKILSLSLCVSLCYAMQALLTASASNNITDSRIPIAIVCLLSLLSQNLCAA